MKFKASLAQIFNLESVPFQFNRFIRALKRRCHFAVLHFSVEAASQVKKTSHLKSLLAVSRVPFPCINNARRSTRLPTSFWTNSIAYSSLEASTAPYPKVLYKSLDDIFTRRLVSRAWHRTLREGLRRDIRGRVRMESNSRRNVEPRSEKLLRLRSSRRGTCLLPHRCLAPR